MGKDWDHPAAIRLAHRQQPLKSFFYPRIIRHSGFDQQCQQRPGVIGGVLVADKAPEIAGWRLAGENILSSLL